MAQKIIRTVGPYTISTDGDAILVNGAKAVLHVAHGGSRDGSKFLFQAEGGIGANGKRDYISITEAEYAIHVAARPAQTFGNSESRDTSAERAYDAANNEGGEGYNPHRAGAERSYARNRITDRRYPRGA